MFMNHIIIEKNEVCAPPSAQPDAWRQFDCSTVFSKIHNILPQPRKNYPNILSEREKNQLSVTANQNGSILNDDI